MRSKMKMTRLPNKTGTVDPSDPTRNAGFALLAHSLLSILQRRRVSQRVMDYVLAPGANNGLAAGTKNDYRKTLKRLQHMGLVEISDKGIIVLTSKGKFLFSKPKRERLRELFAMPQRNDNNDSP